MTNEDRGGLEKSDWRQVCARYEEEQEREWQRTCKIVLSIYLGGLFTVLVVFSSYWMAAGILRSGLVLVSTLGLMISFSELVLTVFEPNPAEFGTLEG